MSSRYLAGLDGLRMVSILLVIMGHTRAMRPGTLPGFAADCLTNHRLGVSLFFVISGFLITWHLRREIEENGHLKLRFFYARRTLRIFPAFYFFLAVLMLMVIRGVITIPRREGVAAAFYYWNYLPHATCWWVGHTWSLAVEEQFYLMWPCTLALCGLARARKIALGIIALSPVLRLLTYAAFPELRDRLGWLLHTDWDLLMYGALLALFAEAREGLPHWQRLPGALAGVAIFFLLFVSTALSALARSYYSLTLRNTLEGVCLATLVVFAVSGGPHPVHRWLNARPVRYVGVISYSLYLWQQLFLTYQAPWGLSVFGSLAMVALAALVTHHIIERPLIRWGRRRFAFTPDRERLRPAA